MRVTIFVVISVLIVSSLVVVAVAQTSNTASSVTSEGAKSTTAPSPKVENPYAAVHHNAPDMVCFGYYPNWSVQFVNGEARYLADNQPDQYFRGGFYYVSEDSTWDWHRSDGLAPMNGGYGLSASIDKNACHDPVLKSTFPYTGQVYLPTGDMVSGCCRKLKPGEAAIGHHGLATGEAGANPQTPLPGTPAASNARSASSATQAGHPVDMY